MSEVGWLVWARVSGAVSREALVAALDGLPEWSPPQADPGELATQVQQSLKQRGISSSRRRKGGALVISLGRTKAEVLVRLAHGDWVARRPKSKRVRAWAAEWDRIAAVANPPETEAGIAAGLSALGAVVLFDGVWYVPDSEAADETLPAAVVVFRHIPEVVFAAVPLVAQEALAPLAESFAARISGELARLHGKKRGTRAAALRLLEDVATMEEALASDLSVLRELITQRMADGGVRLPVPKPRRAPPPAPAPHEPAPPVVMPQVTPGSSADLQPGNSPRAVTADDFGADYAAPAQPVDDGPFIDLASMSERRIRKMAHEMGIDTSHATRAQIEAAISGLL